MAWLTGYGNRRAITISSLLVNSDETHYPLFLQLHAASGVTGSEVDVTDIFDEVGSNYQKIAFTESDGSTRLYAEVEYWNNSAEWATVHVSSPSMVLSSSTDTVIYLYFDSTIADDTTYIGVVGDRTEVWSSKFHARYDMAQGVISTQSTLKDSTSGGYDLLESEIFQDPIIDSPTGVSASLDGSGEWYDQITAPLPVTPQPAYGYEFYIQAPYNDGSVGLGALGEFANVAGEHLLALGSVSAAATNETVMIATTAGSNERTYIRDTIAAGWSLISAIWDTALGRHRMYIDGVEKTTYAGTGGWSLKSTYNDITLGARYVHSLAFDGRIDEVRLYKEEVDGDWVSLTQLSISDELMVYGATELMPLDVSTDYEQAHIDLLIKQYWEKDKARAEIKLKAGLWERVYDVMGDFQSEFDIDIATGDRLDKIGAIVGLNRFVNLTSSSVGFGFSDNPNALGFGSAFTPVPGQFYSIFAASSTIELTDDEYRFYLRAKISVNTGSAFISSDEKTSIQDVTLYLFDGLAYVVDNKDMTLILVVDPSVDSERISIVRELNLLTRPQGVRYNLFINSDDDMFAFDDDANGAGFGDLVDPNEGGVFATLII